MELIVPASLFLALGVLVTVWLTSFFLVDSHPSVKHRGKILMLIIFIAFIAYWIGEKNV